MEEIHTNSEETKTFDRRRVIERRQCIESHCQRWFAITAGELDFYKNQAKDDDGRPLQLPKRCPDCRRKRKKEHEQEKEK